MVKTVNPDGLYTPPSAFSHAAIAETGRLVFVSGTLGIDGEGVLAPDFEGQARQVWANIAAILERSGSALERIVRVNAILPDRGDAGAYRAIRDTVIHHAPASTVVIADLISPDWLIEVEVVAEAD